MRQSTQSDASRRAVIYTRVSTREQVENLSLDTQAKACRELCVRRGYEIAREFREEGESAKTADRTQFARLVQFCTDRRNRVGVLVVYAVDRFMRNAGEHHVVKQALRAAGVELCFVTQPTTADPIGEAMEGILAVLAQLDNAQKGVRTRDGMREAVTRGRWHVKPPLGYLRGPPRGPSLVHDPERAPLIAAAFEMIARDGHRAHEALHRVTALGLRTAKGKPLNAQTFNRMLRNPAYRGRIVSPKLGADVQGDFAPIVSSETFDDVRASLAGGRRAEPATRTKAHPDFPLRVFVRCADCGVPVTGSASRGRGGVYGYYHCRTKGCGGVSIRSKKMEEAFAALLAALQPRPTYLRLFREVVLDVHRGRHEEAAGARARAEREIEALRARKRRATDLVIDGKLAPEEHREAVERIEGEIATARLALRDAQSAEDDVEAVVAFAERALTDLPHVWRALPPVARGRFQRAVFPDGLAFDGERFGTARTASVFTYLRLAATGSPREASLTPPSWNHVAEMVRELRDLREIAMAATG